jgi:glutathione S-transferase
MLKVFGHPASTCTRKVLMTLAETTTPFELTTVDFAKGEHKQQPHLGRQPFGQIPAIDDGGFALFESRAICRYLDEKAGGKLVPSDIEARAVREEWVSLETSHHTFGRAQEPAVLEAAGKGLETALGVMEARLAKSPFLAGDKLTLADVCFMPYIEYAMGTPVKETLAKFPHVTAWWNKVSERPTWQKTVGRA